MCVWGGGGGGGGGGGRTGNLPLPQVGKTNVHNETNCLLWAFSYSHGIRNFPAQSVPLPD